MNVKTVLGVSMSSHDRSAALVRGGDVVAAIAEERLDRRKRSEGFYAGRHRDVLPPLAAITAVLREANLKLNDVDIVACSRSIGSARATLGSYLPFDENRIIEPAIPCHHLVHACAAFYTSPFYEAAILVLDEQGSILPDGRYERASWFMGNDHGVSVIERSYGTLSELSLGLFFNIIAGTLDLSEAGLPSAGKLMALAALGGDCQYNTQLVDLQEDGTFSIRLSSVTEFLDGYFGVSAAAPSCADDLIGRYPRIHWESPKAVVLASIAQRELERTVLHVASALQRRTCCTNLCFGGGIALNCVTNRRLHEAGFKDVYIHPAATDDGNAVGVALWAWHAQGGSRLRTDKWSPFKGPSYGDDERRSALKHYGLPILSHAPIESAASALAQNRIVCWFQGRSEWGPRALGARSILANATEPGITERLNRTVKHRESFRPFAVTWTETAAMSELEVQPRASSLESYMLTAGRLKTGAKCKVVHVDGTVRYQIVDPRLQPILVELLERVGSYSGLEAVLNTSFNVAGEPIAETPHDAVRLFLLSGADVLVLGNYVADRDTIASATLSAARAKAWRETTNSPADVAVRMAVNGYFAEAEILALEYGVLDELMSRLGRFSTNRNEARRQALDILERATLEPAGMRAIAMLREFGSGNEREGLVLAAAEILGSPGGVWSIARRMGVVDANE